MKTVITHIIAYGLMYLFLATSFLGALAVINRLLFHKALLNQWKSRLFWFTFSLIVGCIFDLVPGNLKVTVAAASGLMLLGAVIWVFVKHPHVPPK